MTRFFRCFTPRHVLYLGDLPAAGKYRVDQKSSFFFDRHGVSPLVLGCSGADNPASVQLTRMTVRAFQGV